MDFYGSIKLVNFIRSRVHSGGSFSLDAIKEEFHDEKYLKPVLEDDAVLFSLDELPDVELEVGNTEEGTAKEAVNSSGELVARVSELEEELRRVQTQFENYKATVSETLDDRWNDRSKGGAAKNVEEAQEKRDDDSHYFTSYSYNGMCLNISLICLTNLT